jgi:hypothetical protein
MQVKLSILIGAFTIGIPAAATAQAQEPTPPAGEATSQAQTEQVTKATEADIKVGAAVYDAKGNSVGKIESVDSKGAVVSTGSVRATLALSSFGLNDKGLVIAMTRAELEAAAKEKSPK